MDKYAVVGNPIQHSKSPQIHKAFATQLKQNMEYKTLLSEEQSFEKDLKNFFANGGKGLNITLPFKLKAYHFADEVTQRAQLAEAVNTLIKLESGKILGDNTDGYGLIQDLLENQQQKVKGKNILLIGAGGAVQGVLGPLLDQKPKKIILTNRTLTKAQVLANKFSNKGNISALGFDELNQRTKNKQEHFDIIINGSSASVTGEIPPLASHIISKETFCYDMMYQKGGTAFTHWVELQGCKKHSDGLGMLVEQAAEAFFLWRHCRPETKTVIKNLRKGL